MEDQVARNLSQTVSSIARIWGRCKNEEFNLTVNAGFKELSEQLKGQQKENPFGLPYHIRIWGDGWGIQKLGMQQYFLHKYLPETFTSDLVFNALNFVLGNHPGENTSSIASGSRFPFGHCCLWR